jgi:CheY-like chemotaxis protein
MLGRRPDRNPNLCAFPVSAISVGLVVLQSDARVDILVTDVGLPSGMNGRQVADGDRISRPEPPVLFITGYADASAAVGEGHLPPGMQVTVKPFDIPVFVRTVQGDDLFEFADRERYIQQPGSQRGSPTATKSSGHCRRQSMLRWRLRSDA